MMSGGSVEVAVVCGHEESHHWIPRIKQWCMETRDDPLCAGTVSHVERMHDLHAAVYWVQERPRNRILVVIGFGRSQIFEGLSPAGLSFNDPGQLEMIIHSLGWDSAAVDHPSASLFAKTPTIIREDGDLLWALHKSILRVCARRYVTPRVLESKDEFRAYFALRYKVWKELGYLSAEKDDSESQWELDYTDRTSLPLGLFHSDGTLVACGRLVRGVGEEYHSYVSLTDSLIAEQGSSKLRDNFQYPPGIKHPFDVLEAFPKFATYYRRLVRAQASKAEVSRIIVHPGYRHRGLGEALVDSLVALAQEKKTEMLFLACLERHKAFYERCRFRTIAGMSADRFLAIKAPVIAMRRRLIPSRSPEDTWP